MLDSGIYHAALKYLSLFHLTRNEIQLSDYRPTFTTHMLSTVFERVMYRGITNYACIWMKINY